MAEIPIKIRNTIEQYLRLLKENNFKIQRVYLFGSYARGDYTEWSDIDLALVSDNFKGIRIKDKDKIRKITLSVSSSIEVLPFNPNDFNAENPLAKEIMETGIEILQPSQENNMA
jgi:predicted nucleotidyltransferase